MIESYILQTCPCWGANGMGGSGMWGFGFLWPLLWLLVLVGIGGLAGYLLTRGVSTESADRPTELLREQYARGEIDDDEFERRRTRLREQ